MSENDGTPSPPEEFDLSTFPQDTVLHDRRTGGERRRPRRAAGPPKPDRPPVERRAKKERRRRIDPTTFEKEYTVDEIEFMNAMQQFKVRTGIEFPTYGEVLQVASSLGYHKTTPIPTPEAADAPFLAETSDPSRSVDMALIPE